MKTRMKSIILLLTLATLMTACYRMPTDDDFSLVPATNNPAVTGERDESAMPGMGY
jgi:PBP1b-binding outer membrane lipoprotein LpoB